MQKSLKTDLKPIPRLRLNPSKHSLRFDNRSYWTAIQATIE
jgi:hypothetical protein